MALEAPRNLRYGLKNWPIVGDHGRIRTPAGRVAREGLMNHPSFASLVIAIACLALGPASHSRPPAGPTGLLDDPNLCPPGATRVPGWEGLLHGRGGGRAAPAHRRARRITWIRCPEARRSGPEPPRERDERADDRSETFLEASRCVDAEQQQPEVPPRRQARPTQDRRVERRALLLDERVEARVIEDAIQPVIERLRRATGRLWESTSTLAVPGDVVCP